MLKASLFPAAGEHQVAFCLVAEETKPAGAVVGMALFFYNYSTWQAKPGLYLEDLCVPRPPSVSSVARWADSH